MSFHIINILVHIITGCAVILCGPWVLSRPKGTPGHKKRGWATLTLAALSIGAALIGAFLFRGRMDLMAVSLLTAYQMIAGLRSLRLPDRGRRWIDWAPALALFAAGLGLLWLYVKGVGVYNWSAGFVYAAVFGMLFYGGWDMLRTAFPLAWRRWLGPAEHAYKMASLIGVFVTVACVTILKTYALPAALSASSLFMVLALVFAIRAARKALGVMPSASRKARLKTESDV